MCSNQQAIQKEIQEFGYDFRVKAKPINAVRQLDWRNSTIEKINQIYQGATTTKSQAPTVNK